MHSKHRYSGLLATALVGVLMLSSCSGSGGENGSSGINNSGSSGGSDPSGSSSSSSSSSVAKPVKTYYEPGETFEFDNMEITFGDDIGWTTVENRYSDLNGEDVFFIPVTLTNLSDETHKLNMFYFKLYGSKGTQLSGVEASFKDTLSHHDNLRSGATTTANLFVLYDGDGDYFIEFDNYKQKLEVKIPVNKAA